MLIVIALRTRILRKRRSQAASPRYAAFLWGRTRARPGQPSALGGSRRSKTSSPRMPSARLERPAIFADRVARSAPTLQATLRDFHRHHASARGGSNSRRARRSNPKPFVELRPASPARNVANRDRDGLLLADENHEPLAASDASVEEISLQHRVVLGHNRDGRKGRASEHGSPDRQASPRIDGAQHAVSCAGGRFPEGWGAPQTAAISVNR